MFAHRGRWKSNHCTASIVHSDYANHSQCIARLLFISHFISQAYWTTLAAKPEKWPLQIVCYSTVISPPRLRRPPHPAQVQLPQSLFHPALHHRITSNPARKPASSCLIPIPTLTAPHVRMWQASRRRHGCCFARRSPVTDSSQSGGHAQSRWPSADYSFALSHASLLIPPPLISRCFPIPLHMSPQLGVFRFTSMDLHSCFHICPLRSL